MTGTNVLAPMTRVKYAALVLGPLLSLALLVFGNLDPGRPEVTGCAAVALLMAVWWITGALPLAATALLPIVLFPILGVMGAREVPQQYFNDTICLFLGGFVVALAMQRWNLHRRIALRVMLLFGTGPRGLLMGFMAPAFLVSMWISNTATTMMMVPIAMSVIDRMEEDQPSAEFRRYSIGVLIGIAFSASIGGTATLIGTPPNLSFVRILKITFPEAPEISFASWLVFGFPLATVLFVLTWMLFTLMFCPRKPGFTLDSTVLRQQYEKLGAPSFEEKAVLAVFSALGLLWVSRSGVQIGGVSIPGWASLLANGKLIGDGTVAVAMGLLLFLIPARNQPGHQVMDWHTARALPWDIVLLFGGGFALATGIASSGLALWVGDHLQGLGDLPVVVLVFLICAVVSLMTEMTSNAATTEILLPVMAAIAVATALNPLLLMIPTTLACSYAFMLPVATPPNAIVFGTGRIEVADMVKAGILINVLGVLMVTLAIFTLGPLVFQASPDLFPDWAVLGGGTPAP